MKVCYWKSFFVLAVLQTAFAFKIPGLSTGSRTPAPASNKAQSSVGEREYLGPVFIIRELNKDKGEYDALITTGGIQEVKPTWPVPGGRGTQPPPTAQNPAAGGAKNLEDSEYFSMLVTPDTVKMLDYPGDLFMNVSLSTLLVAASTRMPWLMVLRRDQYSELFESKDRPAPVMVAGMQIPQRRRYSSRQRRGLYLSPYRHHKDAETAGDQTYQPSFERQLLSTICYNFVRDYASSGENSPPLPITLADTETADDRHRQNGMPPAPPPLPPPFAAVTFRPDDVEQSSSSVEMTVPKRRVAVSS